MAETVAKKRTTMWFQNAILEKLDEHAAETGMSRTMLLHEIVRNWLARQRKSKAPASVTIFD